jgi:hypothetical protein
MTTLYRAARTMPTVLSYEWPDVDGEGPATVTDVQVTAASAAGSVVTLPAPSAVVDGVCSVVVPGQAVLDELTITWSGVIDGATVVDVDLLEIAGGTYFNLAAARRADPDLEDQTRFTTADLRTARTEIEVEFERICDRAFLPRYRRLVLDGPDDDRLILPVADIRRVRSASITASPGGSPVALTSDELAALVVNAADRSVTRANGVLWPGGIGNLTIAVEHGMDRPPPDLKRVAMMRLRSRLGLQRTGIPERAMSWTASNGDTYRLSIPTAYRTGVPEIDAVLDSYSLRPSAGDQDGVDGGGNHAPASRVLEYDLQRFSVFHGHGRGGL